ncbi:MAG TPA: bifunctional lysylphosphatidylglycerol flippase/synthetase MprF [Longimicrobiaceae bacterium]|nr:bifunctional lysylphosphatidylglycerol flippase/synthetase MprF [Longimicrobiaceae bacterium]
MRSKILQYLGPLFGLFLFVLALVVLHHELRGEGFQQIVRAMAGMPRRQIAEALALTAVSYGVLTGYDWLGLRYVRRRLAYGRSAMTSLIAYAFSHALGFPLLTGGSIRFRLYSSWGLSTVQVTNVIGFAAVTFWLGVLMVGGVVLLTAPPSVAALLHLPAAALRPIGVVALGVVAAYVWWAMVGRRWVRVRGWRFRRPTARLAVAQVALGSLDWLLAGSVIYALLPRGLGLTYPSFLSVFVLAYLAGIVSNVPGGLGIFESVLLVLLPGRVDQSQIMGSLLVYRGVYYVLPLITATALLGVHEATRRRERLRRAARVFGQWAPSLVPNVLALTTFLGGAILLFSGATPAAASRLYWLHALLPLPVVELSHFLASLAGIGLLLLAGGLQRRIDAAFHFTVLLLGAGIVFSLLKGLDYEEAIALGVMLAALLPSRHHFFRRASLLSEPFTPGWTAAVLVILGASVWLGIFSHKEVRFTADLWWQFAWAADAPRFLRASVGVAAVLLCVSVAHLFRPAAPEPAAPSPGQLRRATELAARSPDTVAWLSLLGDKALLFSPSGDAFLMYAVAGRSWVALGDPVGATPERAELAWQFHDTVTRHAGWTAFYLARGDLIPLYVDLGLSIFKLGEEARVPLREFSLSQPGRETLRETHDAVAAQGCTVEVLPASAVPALLPEMRRVSDAWLAARGASEKSFSLARFDEDYLRTHPAAVVRKDGAVVAFASVLPGGRGTELSVDLLRFLPDAPADVMDFLLAELMLWGREHEYRWFALGVVPSGETDGAPIWAHVDTLDFRLGEHFGSFQALRRYKQAFQPVWEPRYIASPGGLVLPRLLTAVATLIAGGPRGVMTK